MAKLHMRLSVEMEITDETMKSLVKDARIFGDELRGLDFYELPAEVKVAILRDRKFTPVTDGWDDGGYVPAEWLMYDAVNSGLYQENEFYVTGKERD